MLKIIFKNLCSLTDKVEIFIFVPDLLTYIFPFGVGSRDQLNSGLINGNDVVLLVSTKLIHFT